MSKSEIDCEGFDMLPDVGDPDRIRCEDAGERRDQPQSRFDERAGKPVGNWRLAGSPRFEACGRRAFISGECHVRRRADYHVLIVMISGILRFSEDGLPVEVGPGEWYVQLPGLQQDGPEPSGEPVYEYVHFTVRCEGGTLTLPVRGRHDADALLPLLDELDGRGRNDALARLGAEGLLQDLLYRLACSESTGDRGLARKAMSYLEANHARRDVLTGLRKQLRYTARHLETVMKREIGLTPGQCVRKIRFDRACAMLRETDRTLAEVAAAVGLESESILYRLFMKEAGMSAGEWRRRSRNGLAI